MRRRLKKVEKYLAKDKERKEKEKEKEEKYKQKEIELLIKEQLY